MHVISAESTELFTGPPDAPLQLVRVTHTGGALEVRVEGEGLTTPTAAIAAGAGTIEVPVAVSRPVVGEQRQARVLAGDAETPFVFTVAEPGWTMYMVSHFHYDPVWWNTQAAYTSVGLEGPPGRCRQTNGFDLVRAHLEMAAATRTTSSCWPRSTTSSPTGTPTRRTATTCAGSSPRAASSSSAAPTTSRTPTSPAPRRRSETSCTASASSATSSAANPATAWQLDVFGHDPQFPGLAAEAGLTSSSWARGPHHQWGPMQRPGRSRERMQFASEFEWISPSGRGLLTHYMPAHYSAGLVDGLGGDARRRPSRRRYELFRR